MARSVAGGYLPAVGDFVKTQISNETSISNERKPRNVSGQACGSSRSRSGKSM